MAKKLIILGAGGNAYDVLDVVDAINGASPTWIVAGFLDDRRQTDSEYLGLKVLGGLRDAKRFADCMFINAVRNERTFRSLEKILELMGQTPERFATLIHPLSGVSSRAKIGRGVYICYGASVGGGATLGDHVSIGPNVIVGHDSVVEECSMLAAGAIISGGVHVESSCYIGSGAMIRQHLRIGTGALVGMGAVVVKDVEPGSTVVGNPAGPISQRTHMNSEAIGVLK